GPGRNRGRRAAARSAGRASQIMRVARTARLGGCEFRGHRLPNNHCAGFAQRRYARSVALGAPPRKQRRAVLGRHVGGLDDVLDAERHAVDRRSRPALAPPLGGLVGGCTRALKIEMNERTNLRFERSEIGKAALKEIAGSIGAIGKPCRGFEVRLWHELELIFRRQHGDALRCLSAAMSCSPDPMDLVEQTAALRFGQPSRSRLDRASKDGSVVPSRREVRLALNEWSFGASGSFYQSERTCWTRVSALYLERRCNHHEPVLPNLGKVGYELNHRNALLEQSEVVCDPHFTWIEFDPPPDCLFRKDIHRHRGYV